MVAWNGWCYDESAVKKDGDETILDRTAFVSGYCMRRLLVYYV